MVTTLIERESFRLSKGRCRRKYDESEGGGLFVMEFVGFGLLVGCSRKAAGAKVGFAAKGSSKTRGGVEAKVESSRI